MSSGIMCLFKNKQPDDKAGVWMHTAFCSLQGSEEVKFQASQAFGKYIERAANLQISTLKVRIRWLN